MVILYVLLKSAIDPVVFLLVLIAIGIWVSFKRRNKSSGNVILLIAFLFLYAASISPVSNALCYFLEKDYLLKDNRAGTEKLDIVVVLGGGVSENRYMKETLPAYQTSARLLYAVQVFRKSRADYLVCMGKGTRRSSESEVMAMAAERLGVPAAKIKVDPASRNTWEHAENLNSMFQDKVIRIGLVTSAYHMKRSEREFKKYFVNVIPLPSDYLYSSPRLSIFSFIPVSGNLYKCSIVMREIAGITWYKLKDKS